MKVKGSYTFAAPQATVWPMLQDPAVLANVMPGCETLEVINDNEFKGVLKIEVGPVQGKFNGVVQLKEIVEPESFTMQVNGRGAPGFVKGTGQVRLTEEDGRATLTYEGDAQVGGRLASVGQRLLETSARAIIRQSLEGLDQQIQARMGAPAGEEHSPETVGPPPPPSQTAFAKGVAQNMWEDYMTEENRALLFNRLLLAAGALITLSVIANWFANKVARKVARQLENRR